MTAQIIQFTGGSQDPHSVTEQRRRQERIAEIIFERAKREGVEYSMEKVRIVTKALLELMSADDMR